MLGVLCIELAWFAATVVESWTCFADCVCCWLLATECDGVSCVFVRWCWCCAEWGMAWGTVVRMAVAMSMVGLTLLSISLDSNSAEAQGTVITRKLCLLCLLWFFFSWWFCFVFNTPHCPLYNVSCTPVLKREEQQQPPTPAHPLYLSCNQYGYNCVLLFFLFSPVSILSHCYRLS